MSISNRLNKVENGLQDIKCNNCKYNANASNMTDEERRAKIDELICKDMKDRPEWFESQLRVLRR